MPLRYLQIVLPHPPSDLASLLEDREPIGVWRDVADESRQILQLLVRAEETEAIMDRFGNAYAGQDGFLMVLLPVEAVYPDNETQPEQEETAGAPAPDNGNSAGRISREELLGDLTDSLSVSRVFLAMTVLSAIVAAVGLRRDDVAVIIGAMVIAPLLGPNVAMALATTLGDLNLLRRALITNVIGVTLALAVSLAIGFVVTVDPNVPAIASRTRLSLGDLALALAAGSAGTFAFTRGLAGPVIGVMVAVALMPPLVTFGILIGSGYFMAGLGALMLLSANVICINLAGVGTFLAQGVRPRSWWEEERAKKSRRIAILIWVILLLLLGSIWFFTQSHERLN